METKVSLRKLSKAEFKTASFGPLKERWDGNRIIEMAIQFVVDGAHAFATDGNRAHGCDSPRRQTEVARNGNSDGLLECVRKFLEATALPRER